MSLRISPISTFKSIFMKNQLLWAACSLLLLLQACDNAKTAEDAASTTPADSTAVAPAEFADTKYADQVRTTLNALSAGDMTTYMAAYADNAVYAWNYGDSLAGKQAISDFWTQRRTEVIDSLTFTNTVLLPVKVNKPQSVESPGIWVLAWMEVTAVYKPTKKKMVQWMHMDFHFNADGKVDRAIQYVDRKAIDMAMTK
jgi:hypothetical protein